MIQESLRLDLRDAVRTLRNAPGFTAVALLSLGVGIGANTAVFSAVNALLLRPLPVNAPDELVSLYRRRGELRFASMSYGEFVDLQTYARSFRGVAAFTSPGLQVSVRERAGEAVATPATLVSGGYFSVLGLQPQRGRLLHAGDDDARALGRALPLVISDRFWRGRFGGASDVIGRALVVNGRSAVVVGVAPGRFSGTYTALPADVWLPLAAHPVVVSGLDSLGRRDSRFLNAIGRLAHGVDRQGAEAELAVLAERLARAHPATDRELGFTVAGTTGVVPLVRQVVSGFLALLMGIVGALLLVSCSNLAGLLLARGATRQKELAVRTALGATRWRLLRQLGLEAILLSLLGAGAGLLLAQVGVSVLLRTVPNLGIPVEFDLRLDWRVLGFAVSVSLLAALFSGVLPALRLTRTALTHVLREDASSGGRVRMRLRSAVVVVQIMVSVILLTSTVLLFRGLRRASGVDIGFDPSSVALLHVDPVLVGYDRTRRAELYQRLLERLRARPDVERAAIARYTLLGSAGSRIDVRLPDRSESFAIPWNAVTPDYFEVVRLRLVRGRAFAVTDGFESSPVAVVSEAMARQLWPGKYPVGQLFRVNDELIEVVGVVRDAKYRTIGESTQPLVFFPITQIERVVGHSDGVVVHARVRGPIVPLASIRRELHALNPDIPASATLMTGEIEFSIFPARLAGRVVFACAVFAILLAVVGLHAVAAFTVARRMRELGIRMALGARRSHVIALVAVQSARLCALGLILGVPIAWAVARLLRSFLYGVPPTDPISYLLVALLLSATVVVAIFRPVRRAVSIDPVRALRSL